MKKHIFFGILVCIFAAAGYAYSLQATWDDYSDTNAQKIVVYWQKADSTGEIYNKASTGLNLPIPLTIEWFQPAVDYKFWAVAYSAGGIPSEPSNVFIWQRPPAGIIPGDRIPSTIYLGPATVTIRIE